MATCNDKIVTACRKGDSTAQRTLYDCCAPRIFRLANRLVDKNDAEDIVQQTFIRVFSSINQFAGDSSFETWLFRIAVNECLQHLRREKRRPISRELSESIPVDSQSMSRLEDQELLTSGLDGMDVELRGVFLFM